MHGVIVSGCRLTGPWLNTFQCRAASVRWLQVTSQIIPEAVIEHIRVTSYVAEDWRFALGCQRFHFRRCGGIGSCPGSSVGRATACNSSINWVGYRPRERVALVEVCNCYCFTSSTYVSWVVVAHEDRYV